MVTAGKKTRENFRNYFRKCINVHKSALDTWGTLTRFPHRGYNGGMPRSILCPHCHVGVDDTPEFAGQVVSCYQCSRTFTMPDLPRTAGLPPDEHPREKWKRAQQVGGLAILAGFCVELVAPHVPSVDAAAGSWGGAAIIAAGAGLALLGAVGWLAAS